MWINWLMRISLTLEETSDGTGSSCPWCPCGPEVPDRAGVWSSILSGARTPSLLQPSTVCSHSWSAAAVPVPCTAKHPSHMIYPGRSRTTGRISLWWPLLSIASLTGGLGHVSPLLFYCTNGQSQNRNTVRGCVCSYWTLSGFAYLSCTDKMIPQWLFCKVLHCSLFNIDSFQMAIRTRKKILKKWRNTTPRPSQVSEKSRVPPPPKPPPVSRNAQRCAAVWDRFGAALGFRRNCCWNTEMSHSRRPLSSPGNSESQLGETQKEKRAALTAAPKCHILLRCIPIFRVSVSGKEKLIVMAEPRLKLWGQ